MGREGERESTAGAGGPPSLVAAHKAAGTGLSRLHGRSIVVRERKGSALGVPLPWQRISPAKPAPLGGRQTAMRETAQGPNLRFPHSSGINNSRHPHMRELRIQSGGRPVRIFYAFDPRRSAILLIGGDKTGDDRFYERMIPIADELYDVYLQELKQEGLIK